MSSVIYVSTNWMPLVLYKLQQTKIKDNLNNGVSHPLILQKDKCYQKQLRRKTYKKKHTKRNIITALENCFNIAK